MPAPRKKRASNKPQGTRIVGAPVNTKLTVETRDRILEAIRAGNYMETAAAYAGISKDTLYWWLKRGRDASRGVYHDFAVAVDTALAQSEVRDIAIIGRAAESQWQAAAWRLERRYPDRFGRRQRVDHSTPNGKPFPVSHVFDPAKLSTDELEQLKVLLERAKPDE